MAIELIARREQPISQYAPIDFLDNQTPLRKGDVLVYVDMGQYTLGSEIINSISSPSTTWSRVSDNSGIMAKFWLGNVNQNVAPGWNVAATGPTSGTKMRNAFLHVYRGFYQPRISAKTEDGGISGNFTSPDNYAGLGCAVIALGIGSSVANSKTAISPASWNFHNSPYEIAQGGMASSRFVAFASRIPTTPVEVNHTITAYKTSAGSAQVATLVIRNTSAYNDPNYVRGLKTFDGTDWQMHPVKKNVNSSWSVKPVRIYGDILWS